ncbi:uncharacterized protein F4807DRAFT_436146 [Annulohypoxylon truncatum]|uniref:uncharacterized protein n=1 Tax=Annulohypoxylon truncatum TaxID=327061 RepID=UPI002008E12A|nr:uncharacterized protein F4807DRAFT_436146 [Annulohypoxylon truncatum]KAI1207207.1 hypothetical protein F4807DRAFT_436146 [Annulohypoxylon truncatum]
MDDADDWGRQGQFSGDSNNSSSSQLQSRHLFQLSNRCCKFNITDPRDYSYALIGVAPDSKVAPQPDYGKDIANIYRGLAEYFISRGYGLELISMSEMRMNPSWVPNFIELGRNVPCHANGWSPQNFSRKSGQNAHQRGDTLLVEELGVDENILLGSILHNPEDFSP